MNSRSSITLLFVFVATFAGNAVTAQTSPASKASPPPSPAADETVVLSPFVVSQDSEKGYIATETLNGTRINTSLKS